MAKIYVCGKGLALQKLILQRLDGSWTNCSKYETNNQHRFRGLFHNYYENIVPSGGSAYGSCGIHVVDLRVGLTLPGAVFDGWGQNSAIFSLMPHKVSGHSDFNDTIGPATSRWFEFGPFMWKGPGVSVSNTVVKFQTLHREIFHIPAAPEANLVASSS